MFVFLCTFARKIQETCPMREITLDIIRARHSVRRYLDKPIEAEKIAEIQQLIDECNQESGLHIQLVINEPLAFSTGVFKYGRFSGVKNYLALVAPKKGEWKERVGYYGQKIVLLMQTMGLNTCWVALTYRNVKDAYELRDGEELKLVVSCGYGENAGTAHPQKKSLSDLSKDARSQQGELPQWFQCGMEAAMLAPTALNQQKYLITLHDNNMVSAKARFDLFGNAGYDLGIVKCNFEIGAGKENFKWKS